ncbi:MAG: ABC transporter permease [Lachnospiraceae bacterium]|nr:ABC transporter permease [Lachnospiraceae bacterium]
MKKWLQGLSLKDILRGCGALLCLLLFAGISLVERLTIDRLYDQQMAGRWSKENNVAQISCFFAADGAESADYFTGLGITIDKKLVEASIASEDEQTRLRIDVLSIPGKITISYGSKSVELEALGVQGDFFQFHPLTLLDGSYFGPDSMMQDGIVIDEEAAWQLFGSNDVAGMQVMIGQVPHLISGVVRRNTGKLAEAAGLDKSVCYLSMESLEKYGSVTGGYCYEMVMPNPVKGFALSTVSEVVDAENTEVNILENTGRFEAFVLIKKLLEFGTRSMSRQGIVYPYWENVARGYEDILLLTLVVKIILLIYPCVFLIWSLMRLWKKRTWRAADGYRYLKDKLYDLQVKRHKVKNERKK